MRSKFTIKKNKDILLFSTSVENLFINELLPVAPGDYVKIYLFALMYAEEEETIPNEKMARILGVSLEKIDKAWDFWEKKGAVKRILGDREKGTDDTIVFLSQIEKIFGMETGDKPPETVSDETRAKLVDKELKALFTEFEEAKGEPVSQREMETIADAVGTFGIMPDVFSYAIRYCSELGKTNIEYVSKVAMNWKEEGCSDIAKVKALLEKRSRRNAMYKRIFSEMGFNRIPNRGDRELMAKWFDELGFGLDEVLNACSKTAGLREPSLRYVDSVLRNMKREAGGIDTGAKKPESGQTANVSRKVLKEYYQALRDEAERAAAARKEEACARDPNLKKALAFRDELNEQILSFSFSPEAKEHREEQKRRKSGLDATIAKILVENGFPEDYLDIKYRCRICKDTGITDDGSNCVCVKERADEAYKWNIERNR